MPDTLVLDLAGMPIGFVSWQRAVKLYWEDRATIVIDDPTKVLRSPSLEMGMPRVIRAKNFVAKKTKTAIPFSRKNIYIRDERTCQYCNELLELQDVTLDHITPRSKGGTSTWQNIVVACLDCNKNKAGLTLKEAGMTLLRQPVEPKATDKRYNFKLHISKLRPEWEPWASWLYWNVKLEE